MNQSTNDLTHVFVVITRTLSPMSPRETAFKTAVNKGDKTDEAVLKTRVNPCAFLFVDGWALAQRNNGEVWDTWLGMPESSPALRNSRFDDWKNSFLSEYDVNKPNIKYVFFIHFAGLKEEAAAQRQEILKGLLTNPTTPNVEVYPYTSEGFAGGRLLSIDDIYLGNKDASLNFEQFMKATSKMQHLVEPVNKVLRALEKKYFGYELSSEESLLCGLLAETWFSKEANKLFTSPPVIEANTGKMPRYQVCKSLFENSNSSDSVAAEKAETSFHEQYFKGVLEEKVWSEGTNAFDFGIVFLSIDDLFSGSDFFKSLNASKTEWRKGIGQKPILFVGLLPFNLDSLSFTEGSLSTALEAYRDAYFDPRFRYLDSTIWHRYISISELQHIGIQSIAEDFNQFVPLYNRVVTHEFFDFQRRLFSNSYIEKIASSTTAFTLMHGGAVTPFAFHSESKMKAKIQIEKQCLAGLKWHILLVDDFAQIPLEPLKNEDINKIVSESDLTKEQIIKTLLKNVGIETDGENPQVKITCAKTIAEARAYLNVPKGPHFDIILLDYLIYDDSGRPHYGDKLLKELLLNSDNLTPERLGPLQKWWFFPISVYQNALTDKLRDAGITLYNDKWIFSAGADPVCTPHLFVYKLLNMMKRQAEEIADFKKDEGKMVSKLHESLKKIKGTKEQIMQNATLEYPKIVTLGSILLKLIEFKGNIEGKTEPRSVFAKTAIEQFFFGMDAHLWEHLTHLLYLLINGNNTYRNQMWDECMWLEGRLNREELKDFWGALKLYIAEF